MIISFEEAKKIYPDVTQEDIDGIEKTIRAETNNPFQNFQVRYHNLRFINEKKVETLNDLEGLRSGDTVQISSSKWNDGLYVIDVVDGMQITFAGEPRFFVAHDKEAFLTKVEYPADVVAGVRKLLKYEDKMSDKIGLKSETIARMSKTYYDQNSTETIAGYPAAMMSFINKYRLMKW